MSDRLDIGLGDRPFRRIDNGFPVEKLGANTLHEVVSGVPERDFDFEGSRSDDPVAPGVADRIDEIVGVLAASGYTIKDAAPPPRLIDAASNRSVPQQITGNGES